MRTLLVLRHAARQERDNNDPTECASSCKLNMTVLLLHSWSGRNHTHRVASGPQHGAGAPACVPLPSTDCCAATLQAKPNVQLHLLGTTLDGRDMSMLQVCGAYGSRSVQLTEHLQAAGACCRQLQAQNTAQHGASWFVARAHA